jgi:hypothetical protein
MLLATHSRLAADLRIDGSMRSTRPAPELPAPVRRFEVAFGNESAREIATLAMEGRGRVHIGRLPWMPIDVRMYHRLGHDYVGLIRVRPARVTLVSVVDAYVDGQGITKIGPAASIGPEIDQGAFLGMWAAAIAYPSTWVRVRWEAVDDTTARVHLPFKDGGESAIVRYDPATGNPLRFEADRHRVAGGPKIRWYGDSAEWSSFDGVPAPRSVTAWWSDQPAPWFEMTVETVRADVDVDEAIEIGRGQSAGRGRSRTGDGDDLTLALRNSPPRARRDPSARLPR